jgi:hypothetical protein
MSLPTIEEICTVFAEYRSNVRGLTLKAKNENWSGEQLSKEIEKASVDVDALIYYWKQYLDFQNRLTEKTKKMVSK